MHFRKKNNKFVHSYQTIFHENFFWAVLILQLLILKLILKNSKRCVQHLKNDKSLTYQKWYLIILLKFLTFWRRLTLSWRRLLSYRNQSIDLLRKSMDWFLYDNGLRQERVKELIQNSKPNLDFFRERGKNIISTSIAA